MTSQGEAKRFFIERIVAQSRREAAPLSRAETWMLAFSESDPQFDLDAGLLEQFGSETSDEEYETKIAGFLERGYEQDINADSQMTATYREAYARLAEGDHYLLVMIDRALGSTLRRRR